MEDEEAEVNVKIKKAYCPPLIVEGNPCLEYIKYIVFPWFNKFEVERDEKNGGYKAYTSVEELLADYEKGDLHPADVKPALSKALNRILQPVRDHFKNNSEARELLKKVKNIDVILNKVQFLSVTITRFTDYINEAYGYQKNSN
ncbi:hypothetical protein QJS04_geneDACA021663 [Acorus gramineus]|uniref:tyrosine--tRNA ligase n=1 Tax=Acorus gramineus TaxID=55184 RepID=A0AAV9ABN3_ACOGR|nr:hypothetical protein QJS04_geneDACA021663 [Acorus gramineus]